MRILILIFFTFAFILKSYGQQMELDFDGTADKSATTTTDKPSSEDQTAPPPSGTEEETAPQEDISLKDCEGERGAEWKKIVEEAKQNPRSAVDYWATQLNEVATEEANKVTKDTNSDEWKEALREAKSKHGNKYIQCLGYTYMMTFPNEVQAKGRRKKAAGDKILCVNYGVHTLDYEACSKLIDAYDFGTVAEMGVSALSQIQFQNDSHKAATEYTKDAQNPVAALDAQRKGIKSQSKIATEQAAFHAAKAAAIYKYYHSMPNEEEITENCNRYMDSSTIDEINDEKKFKGAYTIQLETLCAMTAQGRVNWLANKEAQDAAKRILAEETMNSTVKAAQAALLNKQAKKLKGAIDQVNAFDPSSVVTVPETPDLCLSNPNDEKCKLADTRSDVEMLNNGFTVTGSWGGTNASTRKEDEDAAETNLPSSPSASRAPSSIGTPLADSSTPGGFLSNPPGAGSVESGGSATSGGGGGGGAGSVGLPSGGGGGGGGGEPMSSEDKSKAKLAYSGGNASYTSKSAGSKINKKDKVANPFDAMFNKSKSASGVLNFRDPAGKEIAEKDGKSLFDLISNRYRVSQEKKRLLEYEAVEATN